MQFLLLLYSERIAKRKEADFYSCVSAYFFFSNWLPQMRALIKTFLIGYELDWFPRGERTHIEFPNPKLETRKNGSVSIEAFVFVDNAKRYSTKAGVRIEHSSAISKTNILDLDH